jgi:predicted phage baseplate assembly protein
MTLAAPNLDDRDFQSLVDDAKRLVQQRCPEWTDHNVSDPGVTLIEAFAQMVDQLIYRLNRVPDRHYLAFLDLLGVRPFPPTAARGTATFWLSAPQPAPVLVRAETEVATARTDTDDAVAFGTTSDLTIVPCAFAELATSDVTGAPTGRTADLEAGQHVPCFSRVPQLDEALLVGLTDAVPSCAVLLRFDCPVGGAGIDPRDPPLVWEAWNGSGWSVCEVDRDETGGFNRPGDVVLHVPATHAASLVARQRAGWLRCRVVPGSTAYTSSPVVAAVTAMTVGGTVEVVHAETVRNADLGVSDGAPGQRFVLPRGPVVPWEEPSVLEAVDAGLTTAYTPERDFSRSGPDDAHYRLDRATGTVELGPVVRLADGSSRQYGAVPPKGAKLRLTAYRVGGGRRGNVARGMIRVLKTSVPYVARVENRHPAVGGVDGETLDEVRLRGPLELRASGRAVTADDFEELAREVAPDAARVRCVPAGQGVQGGQGDPDAGGIRLLVVPRVLPDDVGRLVYEDLARPPDELLRRIAGHLDGRRLVGTRLVVEPPVYQGVTVVARLTAAAGAVPDDVREAALEMLYRYLSPLDGGPELTGWPFGRPVQAFDLSGLLARAPGVALVEEVLLFPADPATGERGQPVPRVDVAAHGLVHSYQHQVRVQ